MGMQFKKRKKIGKNTHLNISKSGASVSHKAGPVSMSSRGHVSIRLGKGISFRKKLW
jgi:hypothetical protein